MGGFAQDKEELAVLMTELGQRLEDFPAVLRRDLREELQDIFSRQDALGHRCTSKSSHIDSFPSPLSVGSQNIFTNNAPERVESFFLEQEHDPTNRPSPICVGRFLPGSVAASRQNHPSLPPAPANSFPKLHLSPQESLVSPRRSLSSSESRLKSRSSSVSSASGEETQREEQIQRGALSKEQLQAAGATEHTLGIVPVSNFAADRSMAAITEAPERRSSVLCVPSKRIGFTQRKKQVQESFNEFVGSASFDYLSGALVLGNAVVIGVQTDHMAQTTNELPPIHFRIMDSIFCVLFTSELLCRFVASGWSLFSRANWKWSTFDCLLVGLQIVDEIVSYATTGSSGLNFSFMRVLRILRLIRVLRIIRILRLIGELRAIVSSIMGSLRSLAWTVVLIFMMVYIFGIYFTQVVLDHRIEKQHAGNDMAEDDVMLRFFGSLPLSILSLYQAITTGLAWNELSTPLMAEISVVSGLVMSMYIAFSIMALMNVVTGVFVEAALKSAKDDHDEFLLCHVRELFEGQDDIDWDAFQAQLGNEHMQSFFAAIDVDISEAEAVFKLLDADGSGEIDLEEFLTGCLNLKGPAKAIDTCALLQETRGITQKMDAIQFTVGCVYKMLPQQSKEPAGNEKQLSKDSKAEDDVLSEKSEKNNNLALPSQEKPRTSVSSFSSARSARPKPNKERLHQLMGRRISDRSNKASNQSK